jgi:hypothetical protein
MALLVEKAPMLDEYFRISLNDRGELVSLPDLLEGYTPSPEALPTFLLRLATEVREAVGGGLRSIEVLMRRRQTTTGQVDWTDEQACFECVAMELSLLYSDFSAYEGDAEQESTGAGTAADDDNDGPVSKKYERLVRVREG